MMRMRGKTFGVLTVILVLLIVFCVKGTVMSREDAERGKQNHYYAALEQEYLDRTQQLLEEQGLKNCGVNVKWVTDGDGSREYTILLHHRKLDRMTREEKSVLQDMLTEMEFRDESTSFRYVLNRAEARLPEDNWHGQAEPSRVRTVTYNGSTE